MSSNEDVGATLLDHAFSSGGVVVGVTADVRHQHPLAFALKKFKLAIAATHYAAIDIAKNTSCGLVCSNLIGQLQRAEISCVPYLIHIAQKMAQCLVEGRVGIRYNSNAFHLMCVVCFEVIHNLEFGIDLLQCLVAYGGGYGEWTALLDKIFQEGEYLVVILEHR